MDDIREQIDQARESLHDYCFNREKLSHDILPDLFSSVDALLARNELLEAVFEKYQDLIYQVATKHPDESRHETAKRYIIERETPNNDQCASAEPSQ